jgi:hypothetical protein
LSAFLFAAVIFFRISTLALTGFLGLASCEATAFLHFLHGEGTSPLYFVRPVPGRHFVGIRILRVVPGVVRLLAGFILLCGWVFACAFYTLLSKANDLLFSTFTSFNNM